MAGSNREQKRRSLWHRCPSCGAWPFCIGVVAGVICDNCKSAGGAIGTPLLTDRTEAVLRTAVREDEQRG